MASTAWARLTATRIGRRSGELAAARGVPRTNPFTGRGLDDLAAAWDDGYRSAGGPASRSS